MVLARGLPGWMRRLAVACCSLPPARHLPEGCLMGGAGCLKSARTCLTGTACLELARDLPAASLVGRLVHAGRLLQLGQHSPEGCLELA